MCSELTIAAFSTSCILQAAAGFFFFNKRARRYLQYLQQEDYNGKRFLDWVRKNRAYDTRGSFICLLGLIATDAFYRLAMSAQYHSKVNVLSMVFVSLLFVICFFYRALKEENPQTSGKLILKMTDRAKRIFNTAQSLNALLTIVSLVLAALVFKERALPAFWVCQLLLIQAIPLTIVIGKVMLDQQEKNLQEQFANEARAIISKVHPFTVGITGSYGKTSTKVLFSEILNCIAPTFTTPRSINSYMGVTREIRERMKDYHRFAVIEMGAYAQGSISRMCSLTPPSAGIITAVGEMHLERFGGQEQVFLAKSELAQAVPADGILICNGDYELCRRMAKENPKKTTLLYGLDKSNGHLDAYMFDIELTDKGTNFKIDFQGKQYSGFSSLLSKPLLSNALAAFTFACALGCPAEIALAGIRNAKTESNRLEPVYASIGSLAGEFNGDARSNSKVLRLNDAFNSNPVGFSAALEVLKDMPGKRKILVTPGMVELANLQAQENARMAKQASSICEMVVVVGDTNKDALLDGLKQGRLDSERYCVKQNMGEALRFLGKEFCAEGDVILIENDLGDVYESTPAF